ncbi:MAG: sigma-70 family RNA polymerase sigma factor [Planctomycetota bacterium]|nr:sigma-70 family RNA polymerase sigma factor [Planctomycetota bacterium]
MPAEPASTAVLAHRLREGDQEAFDRLFVIAAERLRIYAEVRLGPALRKRMEPDDIIQEAYLSAWQSRDRFVYRDDLSFTHWICRVAENRIRAAAEHHGAKKRTPPGAAHDPEHVRSLIGTSRTGPVSAADRRESTLRMQAALEALAPELRDVLLMRFFEGLTLDDIAHRVGCSPSTARRRLAEGTQQLGAHLGADA